MTKRSQILLRQQIGQLMIVGFDGIESTPALDSLLRELQPSGVILFTRNITSPAQCYQLVAQCRANAGAKVPLFTCVDLEGGTVDRFRHILAPAPSQNDVASTGKKAL